MWLDGPVPDWPERLQGLGSWVGLQVDRGVGTRHLTVVDPGGHQWVLFERT